MRNRQQINNEIGKHERSGKKCIKREIEKIAGTLSKKTKPFLRELVRDMTVVFLLCETTDYGRVSCIDGLWTRPSPFSAPLHFLKY